MDLSRILELISKGRTDLVIELLVLPDARDAITAGQVKPLQWCAYYNDVTAMRLVLNRFGEFPDYDVNEELLNGAYYGHWKVCDFLITQGANVNTRLLNTGETPLHNAIAKADRPHFVFVVQLLLEHGADVNAKTVAGMETGAFMRDVRTRGETPLHRAAAYADERIVSLLLEHGADREARDVNGDSPLSWASYHLRPAAILKMLTFGDYRINDAQVERMKSDHGAGFGNGMDWNFIGAYLPESLDKF